MSISDQNKICPGKIVNVEVYYCVAWNPGSNDPQNFEHIFKLDQFFIGCSPSFLAPANSYMCSGFCRFVAMMQAVFISLRCFGWYPIFSGIFGCFRVFLSPIRSVLLFQLSFWVHAADSEPTKCTGTMMVYNSAFFDA